MVCPNPALELTYFVDRIDLSASVLTASQVIYEADGKAVNVARALARFGHRVTLVLPLGGPVGQWLRSRVPSSIDCDVIPSSRETRCSTVLVDLRTGHATIVRGAGEAADDDLDVALIARSRSHISDAQLLVLSGSLPLGLPQDFYTQLCALAVSSHVRTVVDCGGPPLAATLAAHPYLVKINLDEAGSVLQRQVTPGDALTAARELCEHGARNVIITMGSSGAVAWCDGRGLRATVTPQSAVNDVGAGDACLAGIVHGLLSKWSWMEVLTSGCAAGVAALGSTSSVDIDLSRVVSCMDAVTVSTAS